jgi:hypothetical protein
MVMLRSERPLPHDLILGAKVKGAAVFDESGERVGHIDDIAIDKVNGEVAYAILGVGGFFGVGETYHPLPWDVLRFDTALGGYVLPLAKQALEAAPGYTLAEMADIGENDAGYRDRVYDYYGPFGATPYWR